MQDFSKCVITSFLVGNLKIIQASFDEKW